MWINNILHFLFFYCYSSLTSIFWRTFLIKIVYCNCIYFNSDIIYILYYLYIIAYYNCIYFNLYIEIVPKILLQFKLGVSFPWLRWFFEIMTHDITASSFPNNWISNNIILICDNKFYLVRGGKEFRKELKNAGHTHTLKRLLPEYISCAFPSNGDKPFAISYNIIRLILSLAFINMKTHARLKSWNEEEYFICTPLTARLFLYVIFAYVYLCSFGLKISIVFAF